MREKIQDARNYLGIEDAGNYLISKDRENIFILCTVYHWPIQKWVFWHWVILLWVLIRDTNVCWSYLLHH